jgi:hypothetical protein
VDVARTTRQKERRAPGGLEKWQQLLAAGLAATATLGAAVIGVVTANSEDNSAARSTSASTSASPTPSPIRDTPYVNVNYPVGERCHRQHHTYFGSASTRHTHRGELCRRATLG